MSSFPGAQCGVCKEAEPSLASPVPAGRGCPWEEFYPVSLSSRLIDSTPCRSRIQGLRGKLAGGERGVSKGHLRRGDHQPSAWFFLFFLISCDGCGGGAPSTGASATFPFPSGDLLGALPCVPPDVQRQGSCDQPSGLSPLGIPKQWKGLFALVFRGGNPKSPPLRLDGAVGVWLHSHRGLRPSQGRPKWCALGCSKPASCRLERMGHCLGRPVSLEELFVFFLRVKIISMGS